jgi:hypothetical protein
MSASRPDGAVTIRDFSPGYQDTPEEDTLPSGASPDCKNGVLIGGQASPFGARAILQRRQGSRLLNATVIGTKKTIDGLFSFRKEANADTLLAVCDTKLLLWDAIGEVFNQVGATTPFTAGNAARMALHRNQGFICDGAANRRYDGTALFEVGFVAPTGAPALAAVAPLGAGVTGTYEGFAVWYDSVTTHESSPSAYSGQVAFVAQDRQWTKPAGAPPANVTHWRVYCRRVDTNETLYYYVGQALVAAATLTEAIIDAARRTPGPTVNQNDPPPAAFAFIEVWKGFGVGVKPNDASFYVSKQDDLESWDARNVFLVQRNASIRSGKPYGTEFLIQTDTKSYRVSGDKLPFLIEDLHSSYGNVSQEAGLEVDGWFYAWDRDRGPYRTNTVDWESLADNRIRDVVSTVNKLYLSGIRAVHYPTMNLVGWAISTTSTRRRTVLFYDYKLNAWLPPMTGLEYSALATWVDATGTLNLYAGDYWGRVYKLFTGAVDGPPSGTTEGTITNATAGTITCAAAAFYTTGSGLAGMPAVVKSPSGLWQWVRVESNTGAILTLDTTAGPSLSPVPDPTTGTWLVWVGAIEWYWKSPLWDFNDPWHKKTPHWLEFQGEVELSTELVEIDVYYDGSQAIDATYDLTLPVAQSGMVWGVGLWGVGLWGGPATGRRVPRKRRLSRTFYQAQIAIRNYRPSANVAIHGIRLSVDGLVGRRSVSA